ncbi:GNAT family N-acetyltransferase [Nocardia xishanensis]|uniref:GNAT family N-acetyltransferase n=1 Tax=Nocardia xishanensis TaxID=238964 RepID=UPI000832F006|nr:GNAT family N-acetyltransferase [Nocardia xishanensis]
MASAFDRHLDAFRSYQATPWGRLRYEQVYANLVRHLPARPLTVLDVGGGNGLDAVRLAALGHHVTIVDTSSASLAEAVGLAEAQGFGDLIDTRLAEASDVLTVAARGSIDVVLCHNVIQYVPDRGAVLEAMVSVLRPGGLLSVLAPNPLIDPLTAAVRRGALEEAMRLLNTTSRASVTYHAEIDAVTATDLATKMVAAGLQRPVQYGVRAVCDLISDDAIKHDAEFFAKLLQLENLLADRYPYVETARFCHLISVKPAATVPVTSTEASGRRVAMDLATYEQRVRSEDCFVCAFLEGKPGYEHHMVYDDGEHVAFLNKYPTLFGYALVVPRRHVEDVVADLTPHQYLRLQSAVHKVARAVAAVTGPERTYLMSLGSMQGNAHVHWHVAPLPANTPYDRQQLHAVDLVHGILDYTETEMAGLAARIRSSLSAEPAGRLVVIRGSSGSGKTTVARALQRRFDRGRCVVISQDVVRRELLRESDVPGGFNIELIGEITSLCLARGLVVVLEGIFSTRRYGDMLDRLTSNAAVSRFYAFDLSFEETLRRHATRPQSSSFGRDEMRDWYSGWDPLHFVDEVRLDATQGSADIAEMIVADVAASTTPSAGAGPDLLQPDEGTTATVDDRGGRAESSRTLVVRCWGTSHTEHLVGESHRLARVTDLPAPGTTVAVDRWRNGGFIERLSTSLTARLPDVAMVFHNRGRGGTTSRELLEAIETADVAQDIALFECGTNDVLRRHQARLAEGVDLQEFTRNYRAALGHLTVGSRTVVCLASPPVATHIGPQAAAINRDLCAYNLAARDAARDAGAVFVDCWGKFVTTATLLGERSDDSSAARSPWMADGLHLSPVGDEVVARSLEAVLVDQHLIRRLLAATKPSRQRHNTDVMVRHGRVEDIPACVQLHVDVATEGKWIGPEPPIDGDDVAVRLRNLVATTAGLLVAEHSSAGIVATATAHFLATDVASITMMVASSHRGQGIGTVLLEQLIDWCGNNNAHKVTLQVWPHNLPAIGLYHRAGFEVEGTLRAHYRRRNGELWDAIIMSRLLPRPRRR